MRKILFSLVAVLFAITAVGQQIDTTIGNVKYIVTNNAYDVGNVVPGSDAINPVAVARAKNTSITTANVLGNVTINGTTYSVIIEAGTQGAGYGFKGCTQLESITLNEGILQVSNSSFAECDKLESVTFPASLKLMNANGFYGCNKLRSITFLGTEAPFFGATPESNAATTIQYLFAACPLIANLYLPFKATTEGYEQILHFFSNIGTGTTNQGDNGTSNFVINEGDTVTINNNEIIIIPESAGVINNGSLVILPGGQLVLGKDMTGEGGTSAMAGLGLAEVSAATNGASRWCFVGAPFQEYKLAAVNPLEGDIAVSLWNYQTGTWGTDWPTIAAPVTIAEGFLAWPFASSDAIEFSTNPKDSLYQNDRYVINNGTLAVVKYAKNTAGGNWLALANPYTFNLDVEKFLTDNPSVQGVVAYTYDQENQVWKTVSINDSLKVSDGFLLNFTSDGDKTINFNEYQGCYKYYSQPSSKSTAAREFVTLTMFDGQRSVDVMFAHNEDAEQGYDMFDANKMFATTGIAEPYFVTEGVALVKEEAKELPYYATMNVRSAEAKNVKFVAKNIPEGLAVSIIDGEEVVEMIEGAEYATEVLAGENANRFKVLVKKNVGLADVKELDVTIANSNRYISISTQEDVKVEVYNTLGQKVYETTETNFELNGVASGAYVVKAYNNNASKTQKIVVE